MVDAAVGTTVGTWRPVVDVAVAPTTVCKWRPVVDAAVGPTTVRFGERAGDLVTEFAGGLFGGRCEDGLAFPVEWT